MMNSSNEQLTQSERWARVSLVSLCYFAVKSGNVLLNMWPALIGVWAGGETIRHYFWLYGLPAIVILFIIGLWLQYWYFRFREDEDCIHIRSGLFNRKRLTLYYERVQQADIIQPFYFRPFGLATLGLESAGSAQKEVDIPGIPLAFAEQLKGNILKHRQLRREAKGIAADKNVADHIIDYQLNLTPLDIVRYGLMHNGLLFLLPIIGALSQQTGNFAESFFARLSESWLFESIANFTNESAGWFLALTILISILLAASLLFLVSIIIALTRFWNYSLSQQGDQFQYTAGLATLRSRGFRLHKLQKITISQGVIARILQRYSLVISKTGSSVAQTGQELQNEAKKFVVPVLTERGLNNFLARVECKAELKDWNPINRFYIVWWSAILGLTVTLPILVLSLFTSFVILPAIFVQLFFLAVLWRRWYCYGWYQSGDWLVIKTGFIGKKIVIVPSGKAQKISLFEPPWLRPKALAHCWLWSGSGLVMIPFIPKQLAATVRVNTMRSVFDFRGKWF